MPEKKLIYELIPKIMKDIGAVGKTQKNKFQNYMYRGIDDVMNELHPVLVKHGVFFYPVTLKREREERTSKNDGFLIYTIVTVKYVCVAAEDGSFIEPVVDGEAMDSSDKSANKAYSAALKIFLLQTFCISTEEKKDTENETHELTAPKAKEQENATINHLMGDDTVLSKADVSFMAANKMLEEINAIDNTVHLKNWWGKHQSEISSLLQNDKGRVVSAHSENERGLKDAGDKDTIRLCHGGIVRETSASWLLEVNKSGKETWLPKSKCSVAGSDVVIPEWLAHKLGLIEKELEGDGDI